MNYLEQICKSVAQVSNENDFVCGMDFLINNLQIFPNLSLSREQIKALYICSNKTALEKTICYGYQYFLEKEIREPNRTQKIWQEIVEAIRKYSFVFDDFQYFSNTAIEKVISSLDTALLAVALCNSSDNVLSVFKKNMPEYKKELISEKMEDVKKTATEEAIHQAQQKIIDATLWLAENYKIKLPEKQQNTSKRKVDYEILKVPEKIKNDFMELFSTTGISPELRDRIISNVPDFFTSTENQREYKNLFTKIMQIKQKADNEGILALEEDLETYEYFLQIGFTMVVDAVEVHLIDEQLSNMILMEKDINRQFLMYIALRSILYIRCGLEWGKLAGLFFNMIPEQFFDFKEDLQHLGKELFDGE